MILRTMSRTLIHRRSGRPVVKNLLFAESTRERMQGLLGRKNLAEDTGMLLLPCRSIHMWFMRFPIDAAFLDAELRVLKIARNLRPWQLGWAPRSTHCVLETAAGVLALLNKGDELTFAESD